MSLLPVTAEDNLRTFRFGWYGDKGLGELLLQRVLARKKTASTAPAYDPIEADVGEVVLLVDKSEKPRGKIRITHIETRRWKDFDEALASKIGATLDEIAQMADFANSRKMRPDEEMRVVYFELLSI